MVQAGTDVNMSGAPSGSRRLGFCGRVSRIVTCVLRRHTEVKRKKLLYKIDPLIVGKRGHEVLFGGFEKLKATLTYQSITTVQSSKKRY